MRPLQTVDDGILTDARARLDAGSVNILTRRGNDWTSKSPSIAEEIARLSAKSPYLDGELCGALRDGMTAFNLIQSACDTGQNGSLVFFLSTICSSMARNSRAASA